MSKSINTIYGKKLIYLRTCLLIKQEEMALKFGISQQGYGHLEKGKTNFNVKKIEKICEIFNISMQEFLTLEVPTIQVNTKENSDLEIQILKKHHELLLLEKNIRIAELETENKRLKASQKTHTDNNSSPIYVLI